MLRVSGRLRSLDLGRGRVNNETPPFEVGESNRNRYPVVGQWQPVSFTGAVSSQRVTEEREGGFSTVGNRVSSALA